MAVPVIASSNSNSTTSGGSVTVTAPTGITTGDLLVAAYMSFRPAGSTTPNTPAGWTVVQTQSTSTTKGTLRVMYKVALLADESTPSYTFTATTADYMQAVVMRITGVASGSEITVSELDYIASNAATVISHTGSSTPLVTDSLAMIFTGGEAYNIASTVTTSTYTSTPSATWTELVDIGHRDVSNDGCSLSVATAPYTGSTQVTAYGYTKSLVIDSLIGVFLFVNSPENKTGTNALLSVSPVLFTNEGVESGTTGTNTLLENSADFFDQSGRATTPTQWTNETNPTTTWTNETL